MTYEVDNTKNGANGNREEIKIALLARCLLAHEMRGLTFVVILDGGVKVTRYPLLFGFRDLIAGNGFVAGVGVNGRALLVDEGDGFWMYGVNPGGLAAGGSTASEALSEFRNDYRLVLFDIATEAQSFEDFEREVEEFFKSTNEPTATEWSEAVNEVRSGRIDADWLPKRRAETGLSVEVTKVERPVPSENVPDEAELAA